ncbi:MAG: hypothetical protein ACRBK7_10110 [Acidimicrobiales bacterium]
MSKRLQFIIGLATMLLIAAYVVSTGAQRVTDSAGSAVSQSDASAVNYGVVADPPLPRATPVAPLATTNTLADHDGSVVVTLADSSLRFSESKLEEPGVGLGEESLKLDVGPNAELRAVSADGSQAALFEKLPDSSRITVVDRSDDPAALSVYELPGLVEPEAFSTDGGRLFVIDHQVSGGPGAYRVRPFDLATGELQDILGPTKVPFDDDMNGVGRRQVWSPNGDRLYTLYIRQTHHHHGEPQNGEPEDSELQSGESEPAESHGHPEPGTDGFVHVLDLREEWAFCLDLPPAFGGGDLATTALAVSPDGETVAVADLSAGSIAVASTVELAVTGTQPLPEAALNLQTTNDGSSDELHLAMSGRSTNPALFLASGTQGQWYDGLTLEGIGSQPAEFQQPVRGLTSLMNEVLVWTADLSRAPISLGSPAAD